jgi:predicted DNA-binding protein|tara:strand:- start:764 stop:961 length:198 start_codon:yes stop_codon:yes gene_type:complete
MPRPNKILEETKTYNLLMTVEQWDKLSKMSHEQTKTSLEQVSVADLIREAIDIYIQILEDENEET